MYPIDTLDVQYRVQIERFCVYFLKTAFGFSFDQSFYVGVVAGCSKFKAAPPNVSSY